MHTSMKVPLIILTMTFIIFTNCEDNDSYKIGLEVAAQLHTKLSDSNFTNLIIFYPVSEMNGDIIVEIFTEITFDSYVSIGYNFVRYVKKRN